MASLVLTRIVICLCRYNIKSQHSQTFHTFEMSFMPNDIKKHGHTLKAGRHSFPFTIELEPRLPSSVSTRCRRRHWRRPYTCLVLCRCWAAARLDNTR